MLPKIRPPTHPGEMLLEEFLKPEGITQVEFAKHLCWPYARLNEIIHGKRGVTADSALAFSEALGHSADFWLSLQKKCDLWHAIRRHTRVSRFSKAS